MIKAAFFDLWGTLIHDDPEIGERRRLHRVARAKEALDALGMRYDIADIEAGFIVAGMDLERLHGRELDVPARGRTILFLMRVDKELPERLDEGAWPLLDAAILEPALEHRPLPMRGAEEALAGLKARALPIGLISNAGATPGYVLRKLLDDFGLLRYFDSTVFSDEAELAKPSSAIFERALAEFGLAAEEAVFVGDHPLLDVNGGRRAGLWMVQIGEHEPEEEQPHARISTLADLAPALLGLKLIG
jgi:putative hydrolase of the HAD superfamily